MKLLLAGRGDGELAALARALAADGHEVCAAVACPSERSSDEPRVDELADVAGVRAVRLERTDAFPEHWHKSASPEVAARVRALLTELAPDVAHVSGWRGLTRELVALCARAHVPAVVHLREAPLDAPASCLVGTRVRADTREACDVAAAAHPCLACARAAPPSTPWVPIEAQYMLFAERQADLGRELELAASVHVEGAAELERVRRWLAVGASARWELAPVRPADAGDRASGARWAREWSEIHTRARARPAPVAAAGAGDWYSERMRAFAIEQWDRACDASAAR